jgi:glycosyltransferase involved in cell wall biosynthesis
VFSVGANEDCLRALPNCSTWRERSLYLYGLGHADVVVVQTPWQREALARSFGRRSVLIRSAAPDPGEPGYPPGDGRPRFLWAGRLAPQKRPELLLEVARRCPAADFDLVGSTADTERRLAFEKAAAGMRNVHLHGFVPHPELATFYGGARALVSTSVSEGFPNTFLEAWSRGRPVVTTADPGDVVRDERIGRVADDADGLAAAVREMTDRPDEWAGMASRARAYYLREHRPERILDDYDALLRSLPPN